MNDPLASAETAAAVEAATEATDALPRGSAMLDGDDDEAMEPAAESAAEPDTEPDPEPAPVDHREVSQTGVALVSATSVSVLQSGVKQINARDVSVTQGGVGLARTDLLRMESESTAGVVYARRATISPDSRVMVLIARTTSGDARPVLDWRSALALVLGYLVLRRVVGRVLGR